MAGGRDPRRRRYVSKLTPADWALVQDVFHEALECSADEREAFVRSRLEARPDLAARVNSLLAEDAGAALLDDGLEAVARSVLGSEEPLLERVGRYTVHERLGRGGMGAVYLVSRDDLGRRDALKVLRDGSLSPMRKVRFLREQRILANLSHPGIAQLHDADVLEDGTPYFVMEYVDGVPLDAYCAQAGLSVRDRIRLFREVCAAVGFAHGRAVIHRDLKPSNILVTREGHPKLLDFGISKDISEDADGATRTGLRMMTPAYAAPEQLIGEPVGVFTDVYSLGVILYELLAGQLPFDLSGLTPSRAERVVLETTPTVPSRLHDVREGASELSRAEWDDIDVLCSTAMHREVVRRYPSVEALIRDVDHFLAREPLEARPDSAAYRAAKFTQRHRRPLAASALVLAILSITSVFYAVRIDEERDRAVAEAERARRIQAFTENLFQGGDGVAGPADTLRVATLLERGVAEARLLNAVPETQSEMFLILGAMFSRLGRFDRADSLLGAAHELRVDQAAGDPAETRAALGELRVRQGAYAEGEGLLREALAGFAADQRSEELDAAKASVALGTALEGQGEYDAAIEATSAAVETLARIAPASADLSAALAALSTTHFYAGNLEEADSLTWAAMEIDRELHGDGHPTIADGLINLAAAEVRRGRYLEAEPYFRQAVDIFEVYHGSDHPQTASALRLLGNDLLYQGRLEESEPLLERALEIQERTLSPEHPRLANTLNDLAYIRLESGEHADAVALYERVVGIYESSNGPRHYFVAIGLSNLANALSEGDQLTEAEAMFRDVVERFGESRGTDHLDTGIARIKLGRVLLRQGRLSDAEAELVAGYDIVAEGAAPTVSWLRAARSDLVSVYQATGRPELAERYRAEQARIDAESEG